MRPHAFAALLLVLALAACSARPPEVRIGGASFSMPDASEMAGLSRTFRLRIERAGGSEEILARLETSRERVVLALFSAFAVRIAAVTLQHGRMKVETLPIAALSIGPAELLADLQIAYWPVRELQRGLPPPLSLRERPGQSRTLLIAERTAVEITYSGAQGRDALLVHRLNGYRLEIAELEAEPNPS